ncbi:MAG: YeeE/YedE family protein [Polyangiaceae bacterium]
MTIDLARFTPLNALVGGALIGLAASLSLLSHGRVAGVSGILGGLLDPSHGARTFRGWFVGGLLVAGVALRMVAPNAFESPAIAGAGTTVVAGLLVGFGTRLGGGCTSGHGVAGLSRLSVRSLIATVAFIAMGMGVVFGGRYIAGTVQ